MSRVPAGTLALSLAAALAVAHGPARAQEPSVATVLSRAGDYVTAFQRQLSGVVAEETYVQDVHEPMPTGPRPQLRSGPTHRELKSDLLLVKPEKADRWIQFRDVFEVDGRPIRDRSERLMKLFVEPTSSTASQAEQIVTESARYNIGNVVRNINVPVFALMILHPQYQDHFKFARVDAGGPTIARDLSVPDGAWMIRYDEVGRGTMITTVNNRDLPSRGRFWIDPAAGRVLMSELVAEDFAVAGVVVVRYQADVVADLLVPVEMRERYIERRNNIRIDGAATYGKFRQFQVKSTKRSHPSKNESSVRRICSGISRVVALLLVCPTVQAQPPTLDEVLVRAGKYVTAFERQLSHIVAEERYVQEVRRFGRGPGRLVNPMRLDLRSDLLLVRGGPAVNWIQFRDVFEVDGAAVRDRTERLEELFVRSPPSRDEQIRKMLAESARYNIGDIERNINVPLLALQFLEPANQPRFRFTRTNERLPNAVPAEAAPEGAFRVSVEMWTIQYEEHGRPTIVRTTALKDIRSRGRFWIDPATGHVLMSELIAENRAVRATIDVSYQSEPLIGMLVPIEMRERYEGRRDNSLIDGHATYGRFRQVAGNGAPPIEK